MKIKSLIILSVLLSIACPGLARADETGAVDELDGPDSAVERVPKPSGPKSKINNNYLGINLKYNTAALTEPELESNGFGADIFFESYISNPWSYKVIFGFSYNPFSYDVVDTFDTYPYPMDPEHKEEYTNDETFFNYSIGFTFEYNLLFKETLGIQAPAWERIVPYFYTGMYASFMYYKVVVSSYANDPIPFSDTGTYSKEIPAALGIPFGAGIKFLVAPNSVINTGFDFIIFRYESEHNVGYKNLMNFKLGYSHGLFGK